MNKTAIIIPSRLNAQRLPNKPLKLINNKEMILHVYDSAVSSNVGEVYVATPDQKIVDVVKSHVNFEALHVFLDLGYPIALCGILTLSLEKVCQ